MKRSILLATALTLSACSGSQVSGWLTGSGVDKVKAGKIGTIASNVVAAGTLFCALDGLVTAVPSVNVINASAEAVAGACRVASLIQAGVQAMPAVAVPVPPPAIPTAVPIATVPPATVVAVERSAQPVLVVPR